MKRYQDLSQIFHNELTPELGDCIRDLALEKDIYRNAIMNIILLCLKDAPTTYSKVMFNQQDYEFLCEFLEEIKEPWMIFRSFHKEELIDKKFENINKQLDVLIEIVKELDEGVQKQFEILKHFYQEKLQQWKVANEQQRLELKKPLTRISGEHGFYVLPHETALEMMSLDTYGLEQKKNEDGQNAVACVGKKGKKIHCKSPTKVELATGIQQQCFWLYGYTGSEFSKPPIVATTLVKIETMLDRIPVNWTSLEQVEPEDLKRFSRDALEQHIKTINDIKPRLCRGESIATIFAEAPSIKEKLISISTRVSRFVQMTKTVEDGLPLNHIVELSKQFNHLVEKIGENNVAKFLPSILSQDYFNEFLLKYHFKETDINNISEDEIFSILKEFIDKHKEHKIALFNLGFSEDQLKIKFLDTRTEKIKNKRYFLLGMALLEKIPALASDQEELFDAIKLAQRFNLIKFLFENENTDSILKKLPNILQYCYSQKEYDQMELGNILSGQQDQKLDNLLTHSFVFENGEVVSFSIMNIDGDRAFDESIKNGSYPMNQDVMHEFPHRHQPISEEVAKKYAEQSLAEKYISIFEQIFKFNQRYRALIYAGFWRYLDLLNQQEMSIVLENVSEDEKNTLIQLLSLDNNIQSLDDFNLLLTKIPSTIDVPIALPLDFIEMVYDTDEQIQKQIQGALDQEALEKKETISTKKIFEKRHPVMSFLYEYTATKHSYPGDAFQKIFAIGSTVESLIKDLDETKIKEIRELLKATPNRIESKPQAPEVILQYFVNQKLGKLFSNNDDNNNSHNHYGYSLLCKLSNFATLRALPITTEQLIAYFYRALAAENIAVMQLLINCNTSIECINPRTGYNALYEAVLLKKKESFLFLIHSGIGSNEFNFENIYQFFVDNLADPNERRKFETALNQLCQTNFRFFNFYFKRKFFPSVDSSLQADCIDPLENKACVLSSVKKEDILKFVIDDNSITTTLVMDGLKIMLTKNPSCLFLPELMQHNAESFFLTNLIQPSMTYFFSQENKVMPISFTFQIDTTPIANLSEQQLIECMKHILPGNFTEQVMFALCFQVYWGSPPNYSIRKKLTGDCEIILSCHEVEENQFENEKHKNALFLLDMIKKRIPSEFYTPKRKEKLTKKNLETWFHWFLKCEEKFSAYVSDCQKKQVNFLSLQVLLSKKIFLNEDSMRKILDALSSFRRIVAQDEEDEEYNLNNNKDKSKKDKDELEIASDSNLNLLAIILEVKDLSSIIEAFENPSTSVSVSNRLLTVFPRQTAKQVRGSRIVRSDSSKTPSFFFNAKKIEPKFTFYVEQQASVATVISDLYNDNLYKFNSISSTAIKKEILEKIEFKKLTDKTLSVILRCFIETGAEKLSFADCKKIKAKEINKVLENTSKLTSLNLSGCELSQLEIENLLRIALRNNPNLRTLYLTNMSHLKILSLQTIPPDSKHKVATKLQLETIFANGCQNLDAVIIDCTSLEVLKLTENPLLRTVAIFSPAITNLLLPKLSRLSYEVVVEQAVLSSSSLIDYQKKKDQLQVTNAISQDALLNRLKQLGLLTAEHLKSIQFGVNRKWNLSNLNLTDRELQLVIDYVIDRFIAGKIKKNNTMQINVFGTDINLQRILEISFQSSLVDTISILDNSLIKKFSKKQLAAFPEAIFGFMRDARENIFLISKTRLVKLNAAEYKQEILTEIKGVFSAIAMLINGFVITLDEQNGLLQIWEPSKGICVKQIAGDVGLNIDIKVIAGMIVSVKQNGVIRVWHPYEERLVNIIQIQPKEDISFHSFAAKSEMLIWIGTNKGQLFLCDVQKKMDLKKQFQAQYPVFQVLKTNELITAIENLQDTVVAVGSSFGNIAVIDYENKNNVRELKRFKFNANGVTCLRRLQETYLLSADTNGAIVFWHWMSGTQLAQYALDCGPIKHIDFMSDFNTTKDLKTGELLPNYFSIICSGATGFVYLLTVPAIKLDLATLKQHLNGIEILIDKTEFCFNFSEQENTKLEIIKKNLRKFLLAVFPDLKEQKSVDISGLKFQCLSKRSFFIAETLQKCGFRITYQKTQEETFLDKQGIFTTRHRLNTLLKHQTMVFSPSWEENFNENLNPSPTGPMRS